MIERGDRRGSGLLCKGHKATHCGPSPPRYVRGGFRMSTGQSAMETQPNDVVQTVAASVNDARRSGPSGAGSPACAISSDRRFIAADAPVDGEPFSKANAAPRRFRHCRLCVSARNTDNSTFAEGSTRIYIYLVPCDLRARRTVNAPLLLPRSFDVNGRYEAGFGHRSRNGVRHMAKAKTQSPVGKRVHACLWLFAAVREVHHRQVTREDCPAYVA
jgi:hypothetical protein